MGLCMFLSVDCQVKKPKLAKHLLSCRASYVSCIDCSKVFAWNEWETHTSCVSEAQKYQGNLYQPKESTNKGQLKQDAWVDNVRQAIEDPKMDIAPQMRSQMEKLLGFDNIPRKQKAFTNFVKNSLKIWDEARIEAMWKIIAAANAKPAGNTNLGKSDQAKAWPGWKRAVDEELEASGGAMPWKRLCLRLVERFSETGSGCNGHGDDLELQALSSIPEEYCSDKDPTVTLVR
ncbi:unnamed protein product [Durusdinium trenchii]|uniref:Zinc finger C2H2 LYAR-type domain-containing protein n=1 Tax=Durusdinium trenchii TaxID=1381693 RepID=A0ABP0SDT0_9DINO